MKKKNLSISFPLFQTNWFEWFDKKDIKIKNSFPKRLSTPIYLIHILFKFIQTNFFFFYLTINFLLSKKKTRSSREERRSSRDRRSSRERRRYSRDRSGSRDRRSDRSDRGDRGDRAESLLKKRRTKKRWDSAPTEEEYQMYTAGFYLDSSITPSISTGLSKKKKKIYK